MCYESLWSHIAAQMAVDAINRNGTILRDYDLKLLVADGQCSADMVMKSFIDYLRFKHFNRMVGILGRYPFCETIPGIHFKCLCFMAAGDFRSSLFRHCRTRCGSFEAFQNDCHQLQRSGIEFLRSGQVPLLFPHHRRDAPIQVRYFFLRILTPPVLSL